MDDIVDLVSRSDDELRALIAELEAEEREISRQRRILQRKLDIPRAELVLRLQRKHAAGEAVIDPEDVEGLSRILAGQVPQPPGAAPAEGGPSAGQGEAPPGAGSAEGEPGGSVGEAGS